MSERKINFDGGGGGDGGRRGVGVGGTRLPLVKLITNSKLWGEEEGIEQGGECTSSDELTGSI